jgi:hypothetical protein
MLRLQALIAKIANGTIFGSSLVGRIVGWTFSFVVLGGFLYLMSR